MNDNERALAEAKEYAHANLIVCAAELLEFRANGIHRADGHIRRLWKIVSFAGNSAQSIAINMIEEAALKEVVSAAQANGKDDLYEKAVKVILGSGKPTETTLQRHLMIGPNRASRLLDEMCSRGFLKSGRRGYEITKVE